MIADLARDQARALDEEHAAAGRRSAFEGLDDEVYLMGNSLGPLPRSTRERLERFVRTEWGGEKVRGWEHWVDLPAQVGDRVGSLVGAAPGQVVLGDSTGVQLHKLLCAALDARPDATAVALADDEFPTDRFITVAEAERRGLEVRRIAADGHGPITEATLEEALAPGGVAVVVASLVRFRTGALADLAALTRRAHAHGALVLWDLSHAAGAVPVGLDAAEVDLAVGCTYKYLNVGPGAPAFAYRATRHAAAWQPIHGWFGHADQFAMATDYRPYGDARQLLVGTPPVAGLLAVAEGLALHEDVGATALRAASLAQVGLAADLARRLLVPLGAEVLTPAAPERRGSHLAVAHPRAAEGVAALMDRGIVTDHRAPDVVRMASAPLHTRAADLVDAVVALGEVWAEG